jgi:hypothetical protein
VVPLDGCEASQA